MDLKIYWFNQVTFLNNMVLKWFNMSVVVRCHKISLSVFVSVSQKIKHACYAILPLYKIHLPIFTCSFFLFARRCRVDSQIFLRMNNIMYLLLKNKLIIVDKYIWLNILSCIFSSYLHIVEMFANDVCRRKLL